MENSTTAQWTGSICPLISEAELTKSSARIQQILFDVEDVDM